MMGLTASETHVSMAVRVSHATASGSFYKFNPPYSTDKGEWYFPDSEVREQFAYMLSNVASSIFGTKIFDWRPNGGSIAENAVMMGICQDRNTAVIHFAHGDGGHFAIEPFAKRIGVEVFHLPVNQRTLLIDAGRLESMLREHPQIKLVLLDQSFILREQPLREIKSVLPEGVILCYDCSHVGGLIAGDMISQPLSNGADILIGNTHKTIPGPQKAFIGYGDVAFDTVKAISEAIVETLQSNCHAECLLPMLIAFKELEFFAAPYALQITKNAQAFAAALQYEGFNISGESFGFTETHQVHLIVGNQEKALQTVMELHEIGIRTNNIEIPGSNGSHGLRLGVQAMTRCGMKEHDFMDLAKLMSKRLLENQDKADIRQAVDTLDHSFARFPLQYSFDPFMNESFSNDFLTEVLR
jgi:glycine hydroxymethyltransferase